MHEYYGVESVAFVSTSQALAPSVNRRENTNWLKTKGNNFVVFSLFLWRLGGFSQSRQQCQARFVPQVNQSFTRIRSQRLVLVGKPTPIEYHHAFCGLDLLHVLVATLKVSFQEVEDLSRAGDFSAFELRAALSP